LGFRIRQYHVGKTHSGRNTDRTLLGFKTLITPNSTAMHRHSLALKAIVRQDRNAPQAALIQHLNPLIRGWSNYYASGTSSRAFGKMSSLVYRKLWRWAKRRHPNWSRTRVAHEYWRLETGRWDFASRKGKTLYLHRETPIVRHVKVQGARSPYDGDWVYWAARLGRHPELPKRVATLLKRQSGKCAWCGLYFKVEDLPELDHVLPKTQGGKDCYANWQLLHRHCHDEKTAQDQRGVKGARDKGLSTEEPCEAKVSSTVLQPSGGGDPGA